METEALLRPAALQVWHVTATGPRLAARARFATLADAIRRAADYGPDDEAWVVTEEGDLLSPTWIRGYRHGSIDRATAA
ncbi:hypothetical protein [Methylobacterium sp. A54F]